MLGVAQGPVAAPIGRLQRVGVQIAEDQRRADRPDHDLNSQGEGQGMQTKDPLPTGDAQTPGARMTVHFTLISTVPSVNAPP